MCNEDDRIKYPFKQSSTPIVFIPGSSNQSHVAMRLNAPNCDAFFADNCYCRNGFFTDKYIHIDKYTVLDTTGSGRQAAGLDVPPEMRAELQGWR